MFAVHKLRNGEPSKMSLLRKAAAAALVLTLDVMKLYGAR